MKVSIKKRLPVAFSTDTILLIYNKSRHRNPQMNYVEHLTSNSQLKSRSNDQSYRLDTLNGNA
jgi:hypothetical protein